MCYSFSPRFKHAIWLLVIVSMQVLSLGCHSGATRANYESYSNDGRQWCRSVGAGVADVRVATLIALTEMQMPVFREGAFHRGIYIDSRTNDNYDVRIELRRLHPRGETEPHGTRVGVRVGGFGNRAVCERLLDAITEQLTHPNPSYPLPPALAPPLPNVHPASSPPPGLPPAPVPVETGPVTSSPP